MVEVYIDNNIWDFFYKNSVNLETFFPKENYDLLISKHGKFEIDQIKKDDKNELVSYINRQLETIVNEKHTFGFYDPQFSENEQRNSGFDVGQFTSIEESNERKRLDDIFPSKEKRKETMILRKQEADKELGALSMSTVVVTLDKKKGPLTSSFENGGKVIFLNNLLEDKIDFTMKRLINQIEQMI